MAGGIVVERFEGTPQGGSLTPPIQARDAAAKLTAIAGQMRKKTVHQTGSTPISQA
jgi:hypothetical protein